MWEMSSRLMLAPSALAFTNSSAGVSLEVNMMASPGRPTRSERSSSGSDEQSAPKPSSCRMRMR